jgi:ABC-type branched-subunit amino acid transport system ATPase component
MSQSNVSVLSGASLQNFLLSARGVSVRFGGLQALADVSVDVPPGAIVGLVGPNGAGKSTLFGVLCGLQKPAAGRVWLFGKEVTSASPQARARLGLARTFQHPELFHGLTVREHLILAYRVRRARSRLWKDAFTLASLRRPDQAESDRVDSLIERLSLEEVAHQLVDGLPLGTSRLIEVGRALATSPPIVLLDEPLSGLDVDEASRLASVLEDIVKNEGVSLLLVEHDVGMVLRLASRIYVLDFGQLIASGTPDEVRNNSRVREAYLGDADISLARVEIETVSEVSQQL